MSGLFGGKTTTKSDQTVDTGPSKFQQPFLSTAFQGAQDAYSAAKGTPFYSGETFASMTPDAKASLENLKGYANGEGLNAASAMSAFGANMAGYGSKAGATLDQFTGMANEDPTQANMDAAARYADNPNVQGMIDANGRDIVRQLREETLPGIDRAASAGGNINSSRAGIAAGIAQRGAADRLGDISASIRGDAWNRGLTMAQSDRQSRMAALGQASEGYANLGRTGVDALAQGNNAAYSAYDRITGANAMDQANRQGADDAAFKTWQGQDTRATDLLNRYYGIVGGNVWGQNGTTTGTNVAKTSGNIFGQLAGAAATAASFIPA